MNRRIGLIVIIFLIFPLRSFLQDTKKDSPNKPKKLTPAQELELLKKEKEALLKSLEETKKLIEEKEKSEEEKNRLIESLEKDIENMKKSEKERIQTGFIESIFITSQFGGGSMITGGGGLAFFSNTVRPEVLFGYTPDGVYKDISISAKLNARIIGIRIGEQTGLFFNVGSLFSFFSGNSKVAPAVIISQEIDIKKFLIFSTFSFYIEESLYFVENPEGSMLFQIGIGIRMNVF